LPSNIAFAGSGNPQCVAEAILESRWHSGVFACQPLLAEALCRRQAILVRSLAAVAAIKQSLMLVLALVLFDEQGSSTMLWQRMSTELLVPDRAGETSSCGWYAAATREPVMLWLAASVILT
jgi:hypothetical protein